MQFFLKYLHLKQKYFDRHENIFRKFQNILAKSSKTKANFQFGIKNRENVRLRCCRASTSQLKFIKLLMNVGDIFGTIKMHFMKTCFWLGQGHDFLGLGSLLGPLGVILAALGAVLGRSWGLLGRS